MLVCAFFAQFGTRDRGCSAHPAFPAPSIFEGGKEFASLGRNRAARSRTHILSPRRPGERRDPYAAADVVRKMWSTALLQQLLTVAMGPCVRRDDTEIVARATSLRVNLPVGIPQNILLHLAHRIARQIIDDEHPLRH